MSQENVELVRAMLQGMSALAGSGEVRLDQWLDEFFDPEIEWHDVPVLPEAGVHFGRDAFRRHVAAYLEAFSESSFEIDLIEAVGDRVVVRGRYGGVGIRSGAQVTVGGGVTGPTSSGVYDLRADRILRVQQFVTHAEALEAVGLAE
jgi:predicted ester cyclase